MNRQFIAKHWYAHIYEQMENQTHDVDFLLKVLKEHIDKIPQNILEVACGGGRICIPLAQAGYNVTGFDADEYMLARCYRKMKGLPNIRCYHANAVETNWSENFDVVVMAGNILLNIEYIESETNYIKAEELFIRNAAKALQKGGYLYMDYDQHSDISAKKSFNRLGEFSYFNGIDDLGTTGKTISYGGAYDPVTQIWTGIGHWELTTNNGEQFTYSEKLRSKHIPSLKQVYNWLSEAGFCIIKTYRNYADEPLNENENECVRATILAKKI